MIEGAGQEPGKLGLAGALLRGILLSQQARHRSADAGLKRTGAASACPLILVRARAALMHLDQACKRSMQNDGKGPIAQAAGVGTAA